MDRCESSHLVRLNLAANKHCLEDSWDPQKREVEGPLLILACETATILYIYIKSCSSPRMLHDEPTKVHQYSVKPRSQPNLTWLCATKAFAWRTAPQHRYVEHRVPQNLMVYRHNPSNIVLDNQTFGWFPILWQTNQTMLTIKCCWFYRFLH